MRSKKQSFDAGSRDLVRTMPRISALSTKPSAFLFLSSGEDIDLSLSSIIALPLHILKMALPLQRLKIAVPLRIVRAPSPVIRPCISHPTHNHNIPKTPHLT